MKIIKIIVILLIAVTIITVGGIVAFISFADPNDFKEQIAARVKAQTGRTLSLEGPLEWGFWPKLRLKAGPLALSNAPGFAEEPFLAADEIQIAVATLPLLKQQLEMDTVKLHGARLNLAVNEDGITNWADLSDPEADEDERGEIAAVALGGVDIQDAHITWRDATTGNDVEFRDLKVATGPLSFGDPIAFELATKVLATQPAVDGGISLAGTVAYDLGDEIYHIHPLNFDLDLRGKHLPGGKAKLASSAQVMIDLDEGVAQIEELMVSGLDSTLSGNITANNIESPHPGASGTITLQGSDLATIFKALELPVAEQLKGVKNRGFQLDTEFVADMSNGQLNVPTLAGNILGAKINANISAERINTETPAAKGALSAQGPDLPSLLAVVAQLQGLDATSLGKLTKVLNKTRDKSFDIEASFDSDMQRGVLDVPTLDASLLGNKISGNVKSTGTDAAKPSFTGALSATGPDLPALLAIVATFQGADSGLHKLANSLSSAPDKAFSLASNFERDGKSARITLPKLSAQGLGLVIDGSLQGENLDSDKGTVDARLSIKGERISPLLTALGNKELAKSMRSLNVDAGITGTLSKLTISPLSAVAKIVGGGARKPVDLRLSADAAHANLAKETLSVKKLSLTGLGMNITGNIDATKIKTAPAYSGRVTVPDFNLRKVALNLNQNFPKKAKPQAYQRFGMETTFNGSKNSLALRDLQVRLDRSTIVGELSVADFAVPDVRFGLGVDALNVDTYFPPSEKSAPLTPEAAAAGAAQLPVETLRKLKINGEIKLGEMVYSGARLQNVKLKINANAGKIDLKPVAASLYNGTYHGDVALDARSKIPALKFNSRLAGVAIDPLLRDMTGESALSGTANLDVNVSTRGNNSNALKKGINGPLKFSVSNGVYRGMDIASTLAQVEVMVESKRPAQLQKGGETAFQNLSGTINFKNGVGFNDDMLLDGSGFKVTGNGIVANLHDNTMKYDAKVAVDEGRGQRGEENYNLGGYTVPIRCRGPLGADACKPDIGDIVAEVGKSAIKKEVGKRIEKAIGGEAGEVLKKIFDF